MKTFQFLLCLFTCVILSTLSARANVYATDIKVNGGLTNALAFANAPANISYRLNQAATLGVTVNVWQGTNLVAAIPGGTNMGLNSVSWIPAALGDYSLSITAAASGFTNWQQISVDTNAGNYAYYPNGMDVDKNTNSPYYGRVVVGCAYANGVAVNPISKTLIKDGIYKMNADGSFADEGGFGYGGYTMDDAGDLSVNEMPTTYALVPWRLRIGDDDRIYMLDFTTEGAIVAFDMLVTTNQVVIDDGGFAGGNLGGPHNYANNPDLNDLVYGIGDFDVTATTTGNAAVWLCDSDTNGNWGLWMYHLINGQSDTNDNGTQAVTTGGDLSQGSSGGCMVDSNLDIFVSESQLDSGDPALRTMLFTHWNNGVLPPPSTEFTDALGATKGEVVWGVGASDNTDAGVMDTVLDSRTNPKFVATPMNDQSGTASNSAGYQGLNGGIRVFNAADGSVVSVTNGVVVIQTLTNIDVGNWYTCAAWDNVGNLYAASTTTNLWRAWSPPGLSSNTTVAVAQVIVTMPIEITGITTVPTGSDCANVTINFTGPPALPAFASMNLVSSAKLNGTFSPVAGAVLSTVGSGNFQYAFTNCSTAFFKIDLSSQ
jgi:hypothetical protein